MEKVRNIKLFKNYYKEIRRAEAIKKEYFKEKENKK